jgi:hypothetical protein
VRDRLDRLEHRADRREHLEGLARHMAGARARRCRLGAGLSGAPALAMVAAFGSDGGMTPGIGFSSSP